MAGALPCASVGMPRDLLAWSVAPARIKFTWQTEHGLLWLWRALHKSRPCERNVSAYQWHPEALELVRSQLTQRRAARAKLGKCRG